LYDLNNRYQEFRCLKYLLFLLLIKTAFLQLNLCVTAYFLIQYLYQKTLEGFLSCMVVLGKDDYYMIRRYLSNFLHVNIRNTVFIKTFILFVTATMIPAICIGLLSIKHSSNHIIGQMDHSIGAVLSDKSNMIEQRFKEIDNSVYQVVSSREIWRLITDENLSGSSFVGLSNLKFVDVFTIIYNTVKSNNLIESIYLFSSNNDFVLTDTKYTKTDFYDQEILNTPFEGYLYISQPRIITEGDIEKKVISYVRKFDIFPNRCMYVTINISYSSMFKDINLPDMQHPYEILLFDSDFNSVLRNNLLDIQLKDDDIKAITTGSDDSQIYNTNGTDYYIKSKKLETYNYTLIFIQRYKDIVQTFNLFNKMIVSSLVVILFLSFIAASIFSISVYTPLDHLARKARDCSKQELFKANNIYKEIDFAVSSLSNQNKELESKYKLVLPYMENYSLRDLLTNKRMDMKNYESLLDALGIQFIYTRYVIALVDFENIELTDETVMKLKSFLNNYNEEFIFVLSRIKTNRIAIIINIDKNIEIAYQIFHKMKAEFNRDKIDLTVSLGKLLDNLDDISGNYERVERQLENKFFTGINEIIYTTEWFVEGRNLFYDKNLEDDLLNHIRFPNLEKARETLERLIHDMSENIDAIDYIKYNFFRIISNIIFVLSEFGIDSSATGFTNTVIFEEIQKTSTLDTIRRFIDGVIVKSISHMEELKKTQHKDLVERTIDYLKSSYHRDITLDDVSNAVFMSPRYLCGIFKAESGMTIFEYITKLRMEVARDLLNSNRKISDIALSLGYNNVQSFFRFFKKYHKMTPVQYRKKFFV